VDREPWTETGCESTEAKVRLANLAAGRGADGTFVVTPLI